VEFGSIGSLKQELQFFKRVRPAAIGSQRFPVLGRKNHHSGRREEDSTKLDGSMRQPIRAVEGKAEPSRYRKLRKLDRVNDFVVAARYRACQSPHQIANTVQELLAVNGLSRCRTALNSRNCLQDDELLQLNPGILDSICT
jgi:hypothetical protein